MAIESPYKDLPRELLLAKTIELQDRLNALSSKPKKKPFEFLNWHLTIVFFCMSTVAAVGGTVLAHMMYVDNKADPLYLIPCIFVGCVCVISFICGLAQFGDKKQLEPYTG